MQIIFLCYLCLLRTFTGNWSSRRNELHQRAENNWTRKPKAQYAVVRARRVFQIVQFSLSPYSYLSSICEYFIGLSRILPK